MTNVTGRRISTIPLTILFITLAAVYCGPDSRHSSHNSETKTAPHDPIELHISMQNPNLSVPLPHRMQYFNDSQVLDLLFNTLIYASYTGALAPELAENWTTTDNTYTFTLRKDVTFHNGNPLEAKDVVFSIHRLIDKTHTQYEALSYIEGVQAYLSGDAETISGIREVDRHTIVVRLRRTFNYFLHFLSSKLTAIVPEDYCGMTPEQFALQPVGTGPYRFQTRRDRIIRHQAFTELIFARNENYFAPAGNVNRVHLYIPHQRYNLKTLLYFDLFLKDNNFTDQELAALHDRRFITTAPDTLAFLFLNQNLRPLREDVRIRRIINHGIDREALIRQLDMSHCLPAYTMIPASLFGHNRYHRLDPDLAATLLEDGPVEVTLPLLIHPGQTRVARFLETHLKPYGINLDIRSINAMEYYRRIRDGVQSCLIVEGIPDYPTAYNFLNQIFEVEGILNYARLDLPEIRNLVRSLPGAEMEHQARILTSINRTLEQESWTIPLYGYSDCYIAKKRIKRIVFEYGGTIEFSSIEVTHE